MGYEIPRSLVLQLSHSTHEAHFVESGPMILSTHLNLPMPSIPGSSGTLRKGCSIKRFHLTKIVFTETMSTV